MDRREAALPAVTIQLNFSWIVSSLRFSQGRVIEANA